jgi:predicted glycogen debranching enzyme
MAYTAFRKNDIGDIMSKEWIVTNGIGGYASSTLSGTNTRKYHGILVAALNPPTNRHVLVSKVEEEILIDGKGPKLLATNQYPGSIFPEGYKHLENFKRSPLPTFVFKAEHCWLEKTVFMPYEHNASVVEYKNIGETPFKVKLNPLFAHRDYHSLFHENSYFDFYKDTHKNGLVIFSHLGAPPLYFSFTKGKFTEERTWYKNIQFKQEILRGLDSQEDVYQIGNVTCELQPGESVFLTFTIDEPILDQAPDKLKAAEIARLEKLVPKDIENEFYKDLIISADQFLVHRKSTQCYSIIAGYHWFTDWGRDTMISLLGTTIALGKKDETTSLMSTFLKYLDRGMVPNRFPDRENEEPEYNTVDATLWLIVAIYEYYQKFHDKKFLNSVFPFLGEIILQHIKGTRYNIHVTEEGFIWAGDANSQLTWMDAKVGDYVVTPRSGCPVEINALWYNALKIYEFIADELVISSDVDVQTLITKVERNFEKAFWNKEGYLNDLYFTDGKVDDAIRPNQLCAVSLPYPLLDKEKQKQIVDTVEKHLFTTLGLRTLSPYHPDFRPTYEGDPWSRDTAYHQGTVWPFQIGEFMLAYLAVNDYSLASRTRCRDIIEGYRDHFYNNSGIHCISEIFDGLEPKDGKGCIQQAWSIGALLRVLDKADLFN